ncbi:MFS transporter [Ureaplasma canigenitalium]|uniref:MFS transporter n=1 Tax=Ureaplasma canigenitalium TaxID=42092 RepID=UPI0004E0D7EF|nr:MFS transporter [Ureaplasma canigenitalium]
MKMLDQNQYISIGVNIGIFILFLILSIVFLFKIKIEQKGYKITYVFYILFWIPIMLVRNLNATIQYGIGDTSLLYIVLGVYGFVGIFIRLLADYISFLAKYRKAFLMFAIISIIVTFIPLTIVQNTTTNIIQVVGVGIGASCIGTYHLLFKEQYSKEKNFLAVSLLSIPPLLANFITSPIRSVFNTIAYNSVTKAVDPSFLKYLWVIAILFMVIVFVFWFFIKERKILSLWIEDKNKEVKNDKYQIGIFILFSIIGLIILFIRFSNAGSVAALHLQILNKFNDQKAFYYESYLNLVHNVFQLIAGVLMGVVFVKKLRPVYLMMIGCALFVLYHLLSIFLLTPVSFFIIHIINGFAYGLVYNTLLSVVMVIVWRTKKITAMGVYQSILSIGIMLSGPFVNFLKIGFNASKLSFDDYKGHNVVYNVILISLAILVIFLLLGVFFLMKKREKMIALNKEKNQILFKT